MEDTTMPLESVKFWSGTVRPSAGKGHENRSGSNTNAFLKVRVKKGMLLHVTGACIWDDINEANGPVAKEGRAILQVQVKGSNDKAKSYATTGTLCVLNDGGKYFNGPANATLSAYFETDVQFRVVGNKSVHLYGHLVDARTDLPIVEESEAESSPASGSSSSSEGEEEEEEEDDDDDEQTTSSYEHQDKRRKVNGVEYTVCPLTEQLIEIINNSPRKSVKLGDLGTLYKQATNTKLKDATGMRLTKFLQQNSKIFKLDQVESAVSIKKGSIMEFKF